MTKELMDYITRSLEKRIDDKAISFDLVYGCLNGIKAEQDYPPEIKFFCQWVTCAKRLQDEASPW
jgi:hypothetical protein